MKPRVFVSSTYYDLKYVRERIEKFLLFYGFDTVLFESNNVTYEHGRAIDLSVYKELETCHMMVLIVGGRYGTAISSENISSEEQKRYDDEYVSITRKEFQTAQERNIPVFILIDKNVYSDYENYKKNKAFFEKIGGLDSKEYKFQFVHVDSLNVFKFVDVLVSKPIKTFEKADEIENYLQSQFSGMFYLYLQSLQKKGEGEKILNSVEELNNVTKLMSEMLDSVGKKILGEDNEEYIDVIDKQFDILLEYFTASLEKNLKITITEAITNYDDVSNFIGELICAIVLDSHFIFPEIKYSEKRELMKIKNEEIKVHLNTLIKEKYSFIIIDSINAVNINEHFYRNVKPFVKDETDFNERIVKEVSQTLFWIIL